MKKYFCLLLVAALSITGCSNNNGKASTTTTETKAVSKANFTECGANLCADIEVPMDYENPSGRKLTIAMVKKPAARPSERIGVLLVNPGGPGASGIETVNNAASSIFSQEILDRFDIIGWDPRGAGDSSRLNCAKSLDYLFDGVDYSPDSDEEIAKLKEVNKRFGQDCKNDDKRLLRHLSSEETVKDMDEIRKSLGENEINYLGYSYGTALGQLYAQEFPKNFRTMVLDGVLDLAADPVATMKEQAIGFDDAMSSFFEYCQANTCKYAKGKDPRQAYMDIMNSVDAKPVRSTNEDSTLGPAQLDIATAYYLYSGETGWNVLDAGLNDLLNGDPNKLLSGFSSYVGRSFDGSYDGSYESFLSIGCNDGTIGDASDMLELANEMGPKAPIFGESGILLGLPCATWPEEVIASAYKFEDRDTAPVLVIGTTGDPATPVQWARNTAKNLPNSIYIEKTGEGHTAYGHGDVCVDDLVNNYFISAQVPTKTTC